MDIRYRHHHIQENNKKHIPFQDVYQNPIVTAISSQFNVLDEVSIAEHIKKLHNDIWENINLSFCLLSVIKNRLHKDRLYANVSDDLLDIYIGKGATDPEAFDFSKTNIDNFTPFEDIWRCIRPIATAYSYNENDYEKVFQNLLPTPLMTTYTEYRRNNTVMNTIRLMIYRYCDLNEERNSYTNSASSYEKAPMIESCENIYENIMLYIKRSIESMIHEGLRYRDPEDTYAHLADMVNDVANMTRNNAHKPERNMTSDSEISRGLTSLVNHIIMTNLQLASTNENTIPPHIFLYNIRDKIFSEGNRIAKENGRNLYTLKPEEHSKSKSWPTVDLLSMTEHEFDEYMSWNHETLHEKFKHGPLRDMDIHQEQAFQTYKKIRQNRPFYAPMEKFDTSKSKTLAINNAMEYLKTKRYMSEPQKALIHINKASLSNSALIMFKDTMNKHTERKMMRGGFLLPTTWGEQFKIGDRVQMKNDPTKAWYKINNIINNKAVLYNIETAKGCMTEFSQLINQKKVPWGS